MEIVVKIPDDMIKSLEQGSFGAKYNIYDLIGCLMNGTPLPEHHGDLIDRTKLYNQTAEWEAQALEQVNRYNPEDSRDEWRWWSAVLKERGAFKHDVADALTIIEGSDSEWRIA